MASGQVGRMSGSLPPDSSSRAATVQGQYMRHENMRHEYMGRLVGSLPQMGVSEGREGRGVDRVPGLLFGRATGLEETPGKILAY